MRERAATEEAARAKALEARVRAHYEELLQQTQQQLQLALRLNDEVDGRWMAEIAQRNEQVRRVRARP